MLGIAASISTRGPTTVRTPCGAIMLGYSAIAIPSGVASASASSALTAVRKIRAPAPKISKLGAHLVDQEPQPEMGDRQPRVADQLVGDLDEHDRCNEAGSGAQSVEHAVAEPAGAIHTPSPARE